MGQAERTEGRTGIAAQASARYGSRGVPADWFLDPADPLAGERYREGGPSSLEDQATAFLSAHEALAGLPEVTEAPSSLLVLPLAPTAPTDLRTRSTPSQLPAPISRPVVPGDIDDDGELSWQADALCAQTDPEAFFPEKGGSTRDAKKVCGTCMVRSECLEYALENDERFGIWGGLSERERRRLRKRAV
jgi:WhiB family redox-sensing transcriptional regulator